VPVRLRAAPADAVLNRVLPSPTNY
jgi:hypothetical protein